MDSLNFAQIWDSFTFALQFLPNTLILLVVPFLISLVLGLFIAIIRIWNVPVLAKLFQVLFAIMKGIPVYLLLVVSNLMYILYFDIFMQSLGLPFRRENINVISFAIFILVLAFLPGISEIIRGGLLSVSYGQYEAGYAAGLTRTQTMRRIILPQMVPEIIPGITSTLIGLLKAGALAYTVGVTDIMNAAVRIASRAYDLLEGYIAAAIIYWGLSILIEMIMGQVSKYAGAYQKQLRV
ncbi:MAG: ABC transporter permease subunit [Roseburia sp.]|nr:ABC transporter permease subunit [Roseburia sp.]MCM1243247.1 ABC transporter permease subunit [Roseburia sp.]